MSQSKFSLVHKTEFHQVHEHGVRAPSLLPFLPWAWSIVKPTPSFTSPPSDPQNSGFGSWTPLRSELFLPRSRYLPVSCKSGGTDQIAAPGVLDLELVAHGAEDIDARRQAEEDQEHLAPPLANPAAS